MKSVFLRVLTLCVSFAIIGCTGLREVRADMFYQLRFSSPNISVQAGVLTTLDLYLDETVTGTSSHLLGAAGLVDVGLLTANFQISVSGAGSSAITAVQGDAGLFDVQTSADIGPPATVTQAAFVNNPPTGSELGSTRSVRIGSVEILAGGTVGQSNLFTLADLDQGGASNDLVIDDGFGSAEAIAGLIPDTAGLVGKFVSGGLVVDQFGPTFFGTTTLTIAAVPEPSSFALVSLAFGAVFLRRRHAATKSTDQLLSC